MAKKKSMMDEILDGLSGSGSEIIKDVVAELFGASSSSGKSERGLDELLGNTDLMDSIADAVEDLTGLGKTNSKVSSAAKKASKTKSSSSAKKAPKNSTKKTVSKSGTVQKKTASAKTASKKTTSVKKTTKTKTSSAKKKITT